MSRSQQPATGRQGAPERQPMAARERTREQASAEARASLARPATDLSTKLRPKHSDKGCYTFRYPRHPTPNRCPAVPGGRSLAWGRAEPALFSSPFVLGVWTPSHFENGRFGPRHIFENMADLDYWEKESPRVPDWVSGRIPQQKQKQRRM